MMTKIEPAELYEAVGDLQVITCFFNPGRYRTKRENYERFLAPLRAGGVRTLTVECAFNDDPFELPPGPDVLQVRGRSVMFQKERMLNLALPHLHPECTKVAWLAGCRTGANFAKQRWTERTGGALQPPERR